ncbi:MAG: 3'-5' exoribonuclease [Olsenella sp.]|nr:3'-5' exoribonuclease [Olsenella sp.]
MGLFDVLFGKKKPASNGDAAKPQGTVTKGLAPRASSRGSVFLTRLGINAGSVDELRSGFIAIDFETTGLDPKGDRIVEVGAVRFENCEPVDRFSMLINPGRRMPPSATEVNHITDRMLLGKPKEREAMGSIVEFLGDALLGETPLVAHNAQFDMSFLAEALARNGINAIIRSADTLMWSRMLVRGLSNYKQGTVARRFRIVNKDAHRAESDAEVCGRIMSKLVGIAGKDASCDSCLVTRSIPSEEELEVCAYIQDSIVRSGGRAEGLGFYHGTKGYVKVTRTHRVAKFKFTKKGRYMVLERSGLPDGYPYTEPCTMTEGGTDYVRFYFNSPYDLEPLRGHFFDVYTRVKKELDDLFPTGSSFEESDTESIARRNRLHDEDVARLLESARLRTSIHDMEQKPSMRTASEQQVDRASIEISPKYSREPLSKVRNKGNRSKGFDEGYSFWELGDDERRHGSVEDSLEYFDLARMAGYLEPALYESYALAFRKLGAYDDEIAILDEGIDRLGPDGRLVARRDKALQLLVRSREKAAREAEKKAAAEERRRAAEAKPRPEAPKKAPVDRPVILDQEIPEGVFGARAIIRLDDDFNVLEVYPSVAEASRSTGANAKSIREAAKGKQRHAGGFVWRYADEAERQD